MSHTKDFKTHTKLEPTQKNAIKLCGQEFINKLRNQNLRVKQEEYWREVNKKLNIPDSEAEAIRKEIEKERLLKNKNLIKTQERKGWQIYIYELPYSEIYGKKYIAEAIKDSEKLTNTIYEGWSSNIRDVYSNICGVVTDYEISRAKIFKQIQQEYQEYQVLKDIYLMFLYLQGSDSHICTNKEERNKENFTGVSAWIGLNFDILNKLEQEGLLQQPQKGKKQVTYATLTKSGMKTARQVLKTINLDGIETLLNQRKYHEEYINYKSYLDPISKKNDENAPKRNELKTIIDKFDIDNDKKALILESLNSVFENLPSFLEEE
jgi:hypothetical protein